MQLTVAIISASVVLLAAIITALFNSSRERKMHRAGLASSAFDELFAAVIHARTVLGSVHNAKDPKARQYGAVPMFTVDQYNEALGAVASARARLSAVASPAIAKKLSHLMRIGGPGLNAATDEARQTLVDVMLLLRKDLGVKGSGLTKDDLDRILFG